MTEKLIAMAIGGLSGVAWYFFVSFWMKPIHQYREVRSKVLTDLIYYHRVISPDNLNERLMEIYHKRREENLLRSAELSACLLEMPRWYLARLKMMGCNPQNAATNLRGLANTTDIDNAVKRITKIKKDLGINTDDV